MKGSRCVAQTSYAKPSIERQFVGFVSTVPPSPETCHQYEGVAGTPLVRHERLLAELELVRQLLEAEARKQGRRCSWKAQIAVLNQFIVASTHRAI